MAVNIVPSKWSMYNPQQLERVAFNAFKGCGIDMFTDPASQDYSKFTALTNVMPALSSGFQRRWGLDNRALAATPRIVSPTRLFTYSAATDTTFAGTADCSIILGTDDEYIDILYSELGTVPANPLPSWSGGPVYGVTSREWFYVMNGNNASQKVDFSQRASSTMSLSGIAPPAGTYYSTGQTNALFSNSLVTFFGTGYTSPPTVTITSADGNGSGMEITTGLFEGYLVEFYITNVGSGYTANPTAVITGGGGILSPGVSLSLEVDLTPTDAGYGMLYMLTVNGPMILNGGRTYGLACQNSVTGHISDFIYNPTPAIIAVVPLTSDLQAYGNYTVAGAGGLHVSLELQTLPTDPQVTNFVLLATADGGSLEYMYGLNPTLPLNSFQIASPATVYTYVWDDIIPDTFGEQYLTGPTLLTNNLYVDVDQYGNPIGIANNTPPLATLNKPIIHKNRMFATDGKSVYFSKSLSEVTTSTGLITSKWEEAWPGTNVLDLAYGNETIEALLSDGTVLYIGTDQNIYRLYGSSVVDFSIPAAVFRGVGVASQDCWSVIYKDNIPSGYMWTTADGKIMLSDFNTYDEVGKYVSPLLSALAPNAVTSIKSVSYGPYSLVLFTLANPNGASINRFLVWDSKDGGWYEWTTPGNAGGSTNVPLTPYTDQYGVTRMYGVFRSLAQTGGVFLNYFEPTAVSDSAYSVIPASNIEWYIQTSWLEMGDATALKVLNELELYTADTGTFINVWSARSSLDFASPVQVKSGSYVMGPLGTQKLFLAGSPSRGRYYQIAFSASAASTNSLNPVLESFTFEYFPIGRL